MDRRLGCEQGEEDEDEGDGCRERDEERDEGEVTKTAEEAGADNDSEEV